MVNTGDSGGVVACGSEFCAIDAVVDNGGVIGVVGCCSCCGWCGCSGWCGCGG